MSEAVYILCALTSVLCAVLLFRGYRKTRTALLFWSSLCFVGLAGNNVLLFVDRVVLPTQVDLTPWRTVLGLVALVVLLFGLVWESR
jgi:hypothetical protein